VRFRRRARNVSSFVSGYSQIWNLALFFLLIPRAAAFLNEVYPNRISTSQIRLGLSSWAGRRGPGCASDWHIEEWLPGFLGLVSCTSHLWYLHSTVPRRHGRSTPAQCASRHALVLGVFQWSSSLRIEEVVSAPDIRNVLPRLFLFEIWDKLKEKTDPFGYFRGRPHWTNLNLNYDSDQVWPKSDFLFVPYVLRLSLFSLFSSRSNICARRSSFPCIWSPLLLLNLPTKSKRKKMEIVIQDLDGSLSLSLSTKIPIYMERDLSMNRSRLSSIRIDMSLMSDYADLYMFWPRSFPLQRRRFRSFNLMSWGMWPMLGP
jgi:hypothetical protein